VKALIAVHHGSLQATVGEEIGSHGEEQGGGEPGGSGGLPPVGIVAGDGDELGHLLDADAQAPGGK
jgi:hypothetical protein